MKKQLLFSLLPLIFIHLSCARYYTLDDFQSVPKIDAHIHYNYANPVLLEQAQADNFRLLTVNVESGRTPIDTQESVAIELMNGYQELVAYLSTIGSDTWQSDRWEETAIERINASIQTGASGVKIWKNIGMQLQDMDSSYVQIDHPRFEPVFSHMEKNQIPLLAHIGEPKNCWLPLDEMTTNNDRNYFSEHPEYHMYLHPEMPSYEQIMNSRDHILQKHSNLNVVGAHFGSLEWDTDTLAERLDKYSNFAVDMAARIGHMHYLSDQDYEKVRQFFMDYHDRILYGTDMGMSSEAVKSGDRFHEQWLVDWKYLATDEIIESNLIGKEVRGLHLPMEVIDDIYYNNAKQWYRNLRF